jgi:D-serine deaminase-like pyridoxal phosphate-dependent protein
VRCILEKTCQFSRIGVDPRKPEADASGSPIQHRTTPHKQQKGILIMNLPSIGCGKNDLDTPALCVDLDVLEANIRSFVATCRQHGVNWRPHTKCHKSSAIAQKLLDAGASGVTCAKLGEAEVLAAGGLRDILIANMIVGPQKLARLVALRRQADPIVCVDHVDQAMAFNQAMLESGQVLRVLVEVNIGMNRTGIERGQPALELARRVHELPGLELAGIMGYEGHLLTVPDPVEKEAKIREALAVLAETKQQLQAHGLPCPIVSCGGTGSFAYSIKQPAITELQAGGGMFMDCFYRHACQVTAWDFALTVVTSIVSRPTKERAIIDAGRKTMDTTIHAAEVFGRDDVEIAGVHAEHGILRLAPSAQHLRIGDRLEIIPGYSDLTCVLHNHFLGFRQDQLEVIWPLEARGFLQ